MDNGQVLSAVREMDKPWVWRDDLEAVTEKTMIVPTSLDMDDRGSRCSEGTLRAARSTCTSIHGGTP